MSRPALALAGNGRSQGGILVRSLVALILATSHGPFGPFTREQAVDYVLSLASGEFVLEPGESFLICWLFCAAWLLVGRWVKMAPSYHVVPILAWSLQASLHLVAWWTFGFFPAIYLLGALIEAVLALVVVIGMVALSVLMARASAPARVAALPWAVAGLSAVLVLFNWLVLILVAFPVIE